MKNLNSIIVNIQDQEVTTNGDTCSFIEAGLVWGDENQTPLDKEEIKEYFANNEKHSGEKYTEEIIFTGEEELQLTDRQQTKMIEAAKKVYSLAQPYNTDLYLVDSEVIVLDYHGSTSLREGRLLLSISSSDTYAYQDMMREPLTEEQRDFCDVNNWLSIDNYSDADGWAEFTVDDDDEFESTIMCEFEKMKEVYN